MRRSMLFLAVALSFAPMHATAAPDRVVRGSVLAPESADLARCAWLAQGDRSQGAVGFMIKIDARDGDWYRPVTFRSLNRPVATSGQTVTGPSFTVTFYGAGLGTCAAPPPMLGSISGTREVLTGRLPPRTRHALVTMRAGPVVSVFNCYAPLPWCIVSVNSTQLPTASVPHSFVFTIDR